jgi:hypothetical protein
MARHKLNHAAATKLLRDFRESMRQQEAAASEPGSTRRVYTPEEQDSILRAQIACALDRAEDRGWNRAKRSWGVG